MTDLNTILSCMLDSYPIIFQMEDGLFMLLQYIQILPDDQESPGTNLVLHTTFRDYLLHGTWNSENYYYNSETGTWEYTQIMA